ncbi:type II toxin-antitoxin system HicB family antitoxin [Methylovirgula sp. 4M-Z18]|uniref:type II toxin-antitoxin system HicB family antitoxin n=1 Tax=Methylovirgula sp. 4M-Z18 TaxID=2293567 RepID=UPI000E2FD80D|nr:type II toxin-antitoxin system HicB family antitoxin [Methylovirgula sp. 4M-Z18]RFB80419.1 ribbon-helix-helix protein, CopG family [Methylovirgula sp. 4M-Z18]
MAKFYALVHGKKGAYGVSYPDFPGFASGGATIEEAMARSQEGLAVHMAAMIEDGDKVPIPRDYEALQADPAFKEDFHDSIALALVDVEPPAKAARISVTIDEGLLARIDLRAKEIGESRSGFLAAAARARLSG